MHTHREITTHSYWLNARAARLAIRNGADASPYMSYLNYIRAHPEAFERLSGAAATTIRSICRDHSPTTIPMPEIPA